MIGELLDKAVAVVSPRAAAQRVQARTVYRRMSERAYDAAKKNRLTKHWRTANRSADLELLSDADTIRARARDLVQNNAYAQAILRARLRNIIGSGITPQARTDREEFNELAEQDFLEWADAADVSGRMDFWQMQRLMWREIDEAGECLVHFVDADTDRRPVPWALELIEADRLASDHMFGLRTNRETGNEIRRGVEVDSTGKPVAYWIYPAHPNDLNSTWMSPVRWPAEQFIHLYRIDRIGQTRGVSLFAPVVRWLKDLHYYVENEMQASAVASCFAAAITTYGGGADGGIAGPSDASDDSDDDGNQYEYLEPGMVMRLMPGEGVESINPSRPNSQSEPWINLIIRSLSVGTGLSYERVSRDYSKTNFSANRASDLEDRREFRADQHWFISRFLRPVWERFIESSVLGNRPGYPDAAEFLANRRQWVSHQWQPPGWEWVDPQKQEQAVETGLRNHTTTLSRVLGEQGLDWREVLEQRARERQLMEELDLSAGQSSSEATEQPAMVGADEDED